MRPTLISLVCLKVLIISLSHLLFILPTEGQKVCQNVEPQKVESRHLAVSDRETLAELGEQYLGIKTCTATIDFMNSGTMLPIGPF